MPPDKLCKTIHQYSSRPISEEDMRKLLEIAEDYKKVKNYVYRRFGGIGGLPKLYPGYTVQNEMTESGLRDELGLPSVYFYLAVFEALGDIKGVWTNTKAKLSKLAGQNEGLTEEEKHYLRFILKVNNAFDAVLNCKPVELQKKMQEQYSMLAGKVDPDKLHRYLCRQVRKYHTALKLAEADGFAIAERAYRYGDHGIYISIKEKRKRIFVPLTDNNQYNRQLYIKLFPKENRLEIKVPVNVTVRCHEDYTAQIGLAAGMQTMLTTDSGNHYGEALGSLQAEYADWIRQQTASYNRNRANNPGRKKYTAKKGRYEEQLHSYINHELNRFFETEKPKVLYIPRLPGNQTGGINKKINHYAALWQRGYIRKRLMQKCSERTVEFVEVMGKDISNQCSNCGALGIKQKGTFYCQTCGSRMEEKTNTARNAKKRGMGSREPCDSKAADEK
ncbi:MAG: transposase [Hungatella sp.]|nr:transposase [Hungatella sp.]